MEGKREPGRPRITLFGLIKTKVGPRRIRKSIKKICRGQNRYTTPTKACFFNLRDGKRERERGIVR